ncbi:MAG: NAD(+) synthase [Rikenellaceae bacterium]|nr:NAD(+) synthase [Rikenellaceae bacterium]
MDLGFVRVAAAVPVVKVADCRQNAENIYKLAERAAAEGAAVTVFPELSVTGYTCGDLFGSGLLISRAEKELTNLVAQTAGFDTVFIVGAPVPCKSKLYNCAVVFARGRVLGIVPKTFIPNYEEFYELRWFTSGREAGPDATVEYCGQTGVPFGRNLLLGDREVKLAVEVCEDLWTPCPPSSGHAVAGANIVANLSASDQLAGKDAYLSSLVAQQSARTVSCYVYASAGFGESSTDLVFAGKSMISENGRILARSGGFTYGENLTIYETDIRNLNHVRARLNTFAAEECGGPYREIAVSIPRADTGERFRRTFDPLPFIPSDERSMDERCGEIFDIQVAGLVQRLSHTGVPSAVIGISGGLDSTLAFLVTAAAFDKLSLDRKGITAVTMPGFGTTGRTYVNAVNLIRALGATLREVDIRPACLQHFKDIGLDPGDRGVAYENSQARERTQILMDIANVTGGIVVGTGDLSELALGWATYNGDQMSMYGVNSSVPKTLVRYLVGWAATTGVGRDAARWLADILDTPISPELLPPNQDGGIAQRTEDLVGPYELHDFFLYHFIRFGTGPAKLHFMACRAFDGRFSPAEVKKWLAVFFQRFFSQQFKRSAMPDGPKVGTVSLSPRGDWRMPSDATARMWLEEIEDLP